MSKTPGYTFVSVSTAAAGRLDDLLALATKANEGMEGRVPGLLGRQVGVDRERNAVVVWSTFETKSALYDYLKTDDAKRDHDGGDMSCIATFEMYDLEPVSGRTSSR